MTPPRPSSLEHPSIERWTLIERIFHQARDVPADRRQDALVNLCAGDRQLLAELRALLMASVESIRPTRSAPAAGETWKADLAGRRAGNYELDSLIGTGGMGSVYLAHRCDGQFDRKVAFKFLSAHLRSEFFTGRFAAERALLASLDHPNITRLIDSGVTDAGDPYLVLEYVDGEHLDAYCDRLELTVLARIELFLEACEAVAYAHSLFVIHRDLKPSNILVSREGRVKLLDFGTAKLVATSESAVATTRFQMMTPRYASPEQLRGDPVTAASDVYSLGIILYELVTGAWPFGNPTSIIAGLERAIQEVAPRAPASSVTAEAAGRRSVTKQALVHQSSGPLWDVMRKAIEPEPDRRYASVAEFASDLRSFVETGKVRAEPQRSRRALIRAAMVALIAVVSVGGRWVVRHGNAPGAPSIAVLPFTGGGYLAGGLTSEVAESLARHAKLKVIAQPSSRQVAAEFKDRPMDFREAGKRLSVSHLLTGSVEEAGGRMKVTVSLIATSGGAQIWTSTYQRPVSDLSAIEADVDRAVAYSLGIAQAPEKKHVPNEEAHALYLKARFVDNGGAPGIAQAEQYCRRAVELDPEYGDAWTCLNRELWNKNTVNADPADIKSALEYTLKALALDPDDVRAHYQLGLNAMYFDWDWKRAEREFELAAAGNYGGADMSLALLDLITGKAAGADEHVRRARDLDPVSPASIGNTAEIFALEGRYQEAADQYRILVTRLPNVSRWQILTAMCDGLQGNKNAAVSRLRANPKPGLEVRRELAYWSGDWNQARRVLDADARANEIEMRNGAQTGLSMTSLAQAYAALGDEKNAVKWLDRAIDTHDGDVAYIHVAWQFAKFQNTPEFHRLKRRVNLDW